MTTTKTRINVYSVKQVRESAMLYNVDKAIISPNDAQKVVGMVFDISNAAEEQFGIITLTTKNTIAGLHIISKGLVNQVLVHPREVFKAAILNNANSVIAFHNHPSGDPTPSAEDLIITNRLQEAGEIIGIELLDHIIIGDMTFTSLKEYGAFK